MEPVNRNSNLAPNVGVNRGNMLTVKERVNKSEQWVMEIGQVNLFDETGSDIYKEVEGVCHRDCTRCSLSSLDEDTLFISISQLNGHNGVGLASEMVNKSPEDSAVISERRNLKVYKNKRKPSWKRFIRTPKLMWSAVDDNIDVKKETFNHFMNSVVYQETTDKKRSAPVEQKRRKLLDNFTCLGEIAMHEKNLEEIAFEEVYEGNHQNNENGDSNKLGKRRNNNKYRSREEKMIETCQMVPSSVAEDKDKTIEFRESTTEGEMRNASVGDENDAIQTNKLAINSKSVENEAIQTNKLSTDSKSAEDDNKSRYKSQEEKITKTCQMVPSSEPDDNNRKEDEFSKLRSECETRHVSVEDENGTSTNKLRTNEKSVEDEELLEDGNRKYENSIRRKTKRTTTVLGRSDRKSSHKMKPSFRFNGNKQKKVGKYRRLRVEILKSNVSSKNNVRFPKTVHQKKMERKLSSQYSISKSVPRSPGWKNFKERLEEVRISQTPTRKKITLVRSQHRMADLNNTDENVTSSKTLHGKRKIKSKPSKSGKLDLESEPKKLKSNDTIHEESGKFLHEMNDVNHEEKNICENMNKDDENVAISAHGRTVVDIAVNRNEAADLSQVLQPHGPEMQTEPMQRTVNQCLAEELETESSEWFVESEQQKNAELKSMIKTTNIVESLHLNAGGEDLNLILNEQVSKNLMERSSDINLSNQNCELKKQCEEKNEDYVSNDKTKNYRSEDRIILTNQNDVLMLHDRLPSTFLNNESNRSVTNLELVPEKPKFSAEELETESSEWLVESSLPGAVDSLLATKYGIRIKFGFKSNTEDLPEKSQPAQANESYVELLQDEELFTDDKLTTLCEFENKLDMALLSLNSNLRKMVNLFKNTVKFLKISRKMNTTM